MKRFSSRCLLPVLAAVIVLSQAAVSQACLFNWWGAYRPTYSAYYAPAYSTYYAPSYYTASYVPATTYYASYVPTTTYSASYATYAAPASNCCATCCPSGSCGLQTSYYASTACCSPCASCVACGSNCCADCCTGNCDLASSSSSSSSSSGNPTPVTPRNDGAGSQGRTPTFIEEEDRGTGYENQGGTGDGFSPRTNDMMPEPLNNSSAAREVLQFKVPDPQEDAKTIRANDTNEPAYPVLNLDEKITSRPMPQRTRLIERRSWEQPVLAKNISREVPAENLGWVPVPAPTQLVQK